MLRLESQAPSLIEYLHACISIFWNFAFPRHDGGNPVPLALLTTSELPSGFSINSGLEVFCQAIKSSSLFSSSSSVQKLRNGFLRL
ncbi:hypothetical protein ACFX1W_038971 [Malus domestica]